MPVTHLDRILNTTLPPQFRQIRLELAREPGHPAGEPEISFVIVAPLQDDGRIDTRLWQRHREACRFARHRPHLPDDLGHLVHRPGGSWAFRYDASPEPDDVGYHFTDEHFIVGEYVSIREDGILHTYRVISSSRL